MLSGDVGLLGEACGHVVHDRHNNAHGFLRHWDTLGELQLWGKSDQNTRGHDGHWVANEATQVHDLFAPLWLC